MEDQISESQVTSQRSKKNDNSDELIPPQMPVISNELLEELYKTLISSNNGRQYDMSDYASLLGLSMQCIEVYHELKGCIKKELVLQLAQKLVLDTKNDRELAQQVSQAISATGSNIIELVIQSSHGEVVNVIGKKAGNCFWFFK